MSELNVCIVTLRDIGQRNFFEQVDNQKFNECIQETVFTTSRHESHRFITIAIYNLKFRVQSLHGVYRDEITRKNSTFSSIDYILSMPT